jgi:hypothetical protein
MYCITSPLVSSVHTQKIKEQQKREQDKNISEINKIRFGCL